MPIITALFVTLRYADYYSIELLQSLRQKCDLRVVVAVPTPGTGLPRALEGLVDELHVLPANDGYGLSGVLEPSALAELIERERSTYPERELRLICCDELNLLTVGQLRRRYHLNGPDDGELFRFRDKVAMKSVLQQAGLAVPKHAEIELASLNEQGRSYSELAARFGPGFVIKPVDAAASVGVMKIRGPEDLATWQRQWGGRLGRVQAETFLSGELFHVDTILQKGEIKFQAVCAYSCPNAEYLDGKVLGSVTIPDQDPRSEMLRDFACRALQALGATDISTHMEIFMVDGQPVFLEVAGRPPGAAVTHAYRAAYGLGFLDLDLQLQLGLEIPKLELNQHHAFWAYFPRLNGIIKSLVPPAIKSIHELQWRVQVGEKTEASGSVIEAAGLLVASGPDFERVHSDFIAVSCHSALVMQ